MSIVFKGQQWVETFEKLFTNTEVVYGVVPGRWRCHMGRIIKPTGVSHPCLCLSSCLWPLHALFLILLFSLSYPEPFVFSFPSSFSCVCLGATGRVLDFLWASLSSCQWWERWAGAGSLYFLPSPTLLSTTGNLHWGCRRWSQTGSDGPGGPPLPAIMAPWGHKEPSGIICQRTRKPWLIKHSVTVEKLGNRNRILLLPCTSSVIFSKVLRYSEFQFPPLLRLHAAHMK